MNILIDLHHQALFDSFVYLFEERLGHKVYHPAGMAWFPEYWAIARPYGDDPQTAQQFLTGAIPIDGTAPILLERGITLNQFIEMDIDIMVASYYDHIPIYDKLIKKYHPKAKLITHHGNIWPMHPLTRNYLGSVKPHTVPDGVNHVFYHQEMRIPTYTNEITYDAVSLVNALPTNTHLAKDHEAFLELERHIDGKTGMFGGACRDGSLTYPREVWHTMLSTKWGIHFKNGGDGFGHVIHGWMYLGVPVIYFGHQYRGTLAGDLLKHEITGIDCDRVTLKEAARYVNFTNGDDYLQMHRNCKRAFAHINYEQEAKEIKTFLENLI